MSESRTPADADVDADDLLYTTVMSPSEHWYEVYPAEQRHDEYRLRALDSGRTDFCLERTALREKVDAGEWERVYDGVTDPAPHLDGDGELVTDGGGYDVDGERPADTPLPGQVRCSEGHLCAHRDNYCRVCGDALGEDESELVTDGGAVDHTYDDGLRDARETLDESVADTVTEPMAGGVAIDLVTRQPLFVRRVVAETCYEYYEEEGFNLLNYKTHPYLPVRADDTVYECVFIAQSPDGAHNPGKTYDFPRGRLMHIPVEAAWQGGDDE